MQFRSIKRPFVTIHELSIMDIFSSRAIPLAMKNVILAIIVLECFPERHATIVDLVPMNFKVQHKAQKARLVELLM
jgi:hypothetical protein